MSERLKVGDRVTWGRPLIMRLGLTGDALGRGTVVAVLDTPRPCVRVKWDGGVERVDLEVNLRKLPPMPQDFPSYTAWAMANVHANAKAFCGGDK